jgi:hypothetical protein
MKSEILFLCICLAIALFAAGCSMAKPYSAGEIAGLLEQKYGEKGRFTMLEERPKDSFAVEYTFMDAKREIEFIVTSGVSQSGIIPIRHKNWRDFLNRGIMYGAGEAATALAATHGLHLVPVDSLHGGGTDSNDYIYLSDFSQLDDAAALFSNLSELYRLEQPDVFTCAFFLYSAHPEEITSQTLDGPVLLASIPYSELQAGGRFFEQGTAAISEELAEAWQSAKNNGLLPK